jgi:proline iminopeptidase
MRTVYPDIQPNNSFFLERDHGHRLYIEECGNPAGIPVLFLHGGPGAGCSPWHRRLFNPEVFHIVLFDQRGCGKSTPHASIEHNTTWHLVEDIEAIRNELGIKRWLISGGSWGSALGLAYAQAYPANVTALLLRGIFLCRQHEIAWFYQQGASRLYPDFWQDFIAPVDEGKRGNLVAAYHELLTSNDEIRRMAAARAWSSWEYRCSQIDTGKANLQAQQAHTMLAMACIENHYFFNDSWLQPDQLLNDVHKIADIPAIIVHGRFDTICPLQNAWQLHHDWPASELYIVPGAGHAATEPGITDALIRASDTLARRLGKN